MKLHVCAIRFLFNKILRRRYLVEEMPYPKTPRRLPTVLTVEEVQRLIAAARTLTDRTMLMVLDRRACAMRSCAICRSATSIVARC